MGREVNRLTARTVATATEPGLHADGAGLYLRVDPAGARRWVLVFFVAKRRREMGLGSARMPGGVSLADARAAAREARQVIDAGGDPIAKRSADAAPIMTFEAVMDELLGDLGPGWRNAKHRTQWRTAVARHAPALLPMPVDAIGATEVLAALRPIWLTIPDTASRVRGRIERVLDAARVRGLRSGENPARWRGNLALLLSAQPVSTGHHKAMSYEAVPAFMADLRHREGVAPRALELAILTAARSGEVLGAKWSEIADDVWTIPADRMKAGREHRVPLTPAAMAVLEAVRPLRGSADWVFPGLKRGAALSIMALEMTLRRMERTDATPHGFRSSFRDWAGDCTGFPREIAEAALAHSVGNATEQAYRRGDALAKRRRLMEAWGDYLTAQPSGVVVQFSA